MKNKSQLPDAIILICQKTSFGGAELSQLELLKQFEKLGIKTYLITADIGALQKEYCAHTEAQLILPLPYPGKIKSWLNLFSFKRKTSKFIKQIPGRKIIFTGDFYPLWAAIRIKKQLNIPVYSLWQSEYSYKSSCVKKWIRYGANDADKLIASEPVSTNANSYRLLNKDVSALNPRIDIQRFNPKNYNKISCRNQLKWDNNDNIAICVGQVDKGKGQLWLIENFLKNHNINKAWKLFIVGPLSNEAEIKEHPLFSCEKTYKNLAWLGIQKDIPSLLAAADIAIFPGTAKESFGLAVAEACLMEVPILALDSGAISNTLGEDYPGLFNKGDPNKLLRYWENLQAESTTELKKHLPSKALSKRVSPQKWEDNLFNILIH